MGIFRFIKRSRKDEQDNQTNQGNLSKFKLSPELLEFYNRRLIKGILNNDIKLIEESLKRGADPNLMITTQDSRNKQIPLLFYAIRNLLPEAVNLLIKYGANINQKWNEKTVLGEAITLIYQLPIYSNRDSKFYPEDFKRYHESYIHDFNKLNELRKKIIEILLQNENLEVNANMSKGNTALILAVSKNDVEIVEMLLKHPKIDINAFNDNKESALTIACSEYVFAPDKSLKIIEMLIDFQNIELNINITKDNHLIFWALDSGLEDLALKILSKHNVDVNLTNSEGISILSLALSKRMKSLITYLLNHDEIKLNSNDELAKKLLITAAYEGWKDILVTLIDKFNVDVNTRDISGRTPLIIGCMNGDYEIVKFLLSKKYTDVNAQDDSGFTGLMYASLYGYTKIVKRLVKRKGINVNARNYYNKADLNDYHTALSYAATSGHEDIVDILLKVEGIEVDDKVIELTKAMIRPDYRFESYLRIVEKLESFKKNEYYDYVI